MSKQLKATTLVYMKWLKRNRFLCVFFLIGIMFCCYPFVKFLPDHDGLTMIHRSQYGQVLAIFLFLVFGNYFSSLEKRNNCDDIINSMQNVSVCITAKVIILLVVSFMFTAVIFFFNTVAFIYLKLGYQTILYSLLMVLLYYLIPSLISGFIGMIIGEQVQSRLQYVMLILIWLLISPLSQEATSYIFQILNTNSEKLQYVFSLLNVGGRIEMGATPIYGVVFEPLMLWLALGKLFFIAVYFITVTIVMQKKIKRSWCTVINIIFIGFIFLFANVIYSPKIEKFLLYQVAPGIGKYRYENDYYYNNIYDKGIWIHDSALPAFDKDKKVEPLAYDINLSTGYIETTVECLVKIIANENNVLNQSFTLYRDFEIEDIMHNGKSVSFKQTGDYFEVEFSSPLKQEEVVELLIKYRGVSSPLFPANKGTIYLSNTFFWIPEVGMRLPANGSTSQNMLTYILYDRVKDENAIWYKLTLNTPYEI